MVEGEFESSKALHGFAPEIVPKPIGFGTYEEDDNVHFLLCEFVELEDEEPVDPIDLCKGIAELHRKSIDESPDSQFGFQVTTCHETIQQHTQWTSSWEAFFIEHLKKAVEFEEQVQGPSPDISRLMSSVYGKVCPRLLRPLETEGRTLRPCLVHGGLWEENTAAHRDTGLPYIFDPSALWAHNEYDLHKWRGARYKFGRSHVREYFHHFQISPPENDWEDRHHLYSLVADLHSSTLFPQTQKFRELAVQSMEELVHKFPEGYQGTACRKDNGSHGNGEVSHASK